MLGGLRGEYRRIEDKFVSLQMELKNVQISFDLTNTHGNRIAPFLVYTINNMFGLFTFFLISLVVGPSKRTLPSNLPAWMVVMEHTLGCKQGTLWKAPRNAERDVKDSNAFCRNDFWSYASSKTSKPQPPRNLHLLWHVSFFPKIQQDLFHFSQLTR